MPSGALCHIDNSRHSGYGYDERIEVFGSEGLAESRRKATRDVALYKGNRQMTDGLHPGWFERMEPSFMLALDAFVSSLEGKESDYPTLMDGLVAQSIADAAVDSLHKNQPTKITYWQPA
jgi:myo-inositol 2-dehydrogenase/D-chiro-inositol 1-dehydrogenase